MQLGVEYVSAYGPVSPPVCCFLPLRLWCVEQLLAQRLAFPAQVTQGACRVPAAIKYPSPARPFLSVVFLQRFHHQKLQQSWTTMHHTARNGSAEEVVQTKLSEEILTALSIYRTPISPRPRPTTPRPTRVRHHAAAVLIRSASPLIAPEALCREHRPFPAPPTPHHLTPHRTAPPPA
jgi:hypothetical protein